MIRKTKGTDLATRTSDRTPVRALDLRSPFEWFDEMDRWLDDVRRSLEGRFWGPPWLVPTDRRTGARAPLVDLVDEGREFVLRAELPGVSKEDLDIRVSPYGVELRAETRREKEETEQDYYYRERAYRAFHRTIPLPEEVVADRTEAKLKDGVLEVRVPKKEPIPKREPVKVRVE